MRKYLRIIGLGVSFTVLPAILHHMSTVSLAADDAQTCPCNISAYNTSPECWVNPYSTNPQFFTDLTPPYTQVGLNCSVSNYNDMISYTQIYIGFGSPQQGWFCEIDSAGDVPQQCATQIVHQNLTQAQFEACLCDLQAYIGRLQRNGVSVSGSPFICSDITCQETPTPAPIPTINQWGMIIVAVVLGLLAVTALFVMRRVRTVAGGSGPDGAPQ
jgi:hypothetical protein